MDLNAIITILYAVEQLPALRLPAAALMVVPNAAISAKRKKCMGMDALKRLFGIQSN